MKNREVIKKITGIAMLSVLVVILQLIANYIAFGPVSITLALIPIAIGAIIYGPTGGFILGLVMGIMVIVAPSTMGLFMPFNAFYTILVCLLKTSLAGLAAGFIFKGLQKFNYTLAIILASLCIPIINTGLFAIASMTLFMPLVKSLISDNTNVYAFLFLTFIGFNFLIEFAINSILSPTIISIVKIVSRRNQK